VQKHGTASQATYDNIIRRMRFAWWITKAADTHSEFLILTAFPRQQWLRLAASLLRLYYVASPVTLPEVSGQIHAPVALEYLV
jgi:hypothetical protein